MKRSLHLLKKYGLLWGITVFLITLVVLGPILAPEASNAFDYSAILQPPGSQHIFGTDEFGRDVFSRVLSGARPTLSIALFGAIIGVGLGAFCGLLCGYIGGICDDILMRLMDALMSYPGLILAMLIVVVLGADPVWLVLSLVLVFWPRSTRLCRSVVKEISEREFVLAARSRGESTLHIVLKEILPNIWDIILVDLNLRITSGILMSASLAYLGLGFAPPSPAWGLMVRDGQQFIQIAPWLIIFPCIAVAVVALGSVTLARQLRRRTALALSGAIE